MKIDQYQYQLLYNTVFSDAYPGYIPTVQEAPHGDGKWDTGKRYAMIALKYLNQYDGPDAWFMEELLDECVSESRNIAIDLGIPQKYWPNIQDSAIRVLEYPAFSLSAAHTDFDLFTMMLYRNRMENFVYTQPAWAGHGKCAPVNHRSSTLLAEMKETHPGLHFGELMELINPAVYKATKHEVTSTPLTQYSCIFFAMPRLDVHLPDGMLIADWLKERKGRSRRYG